MHALVVIEKEKLWVYDCVFPCYKALVQRIIYMNVVNPMETHDSGTVDERTSAVIGEQELDDHYNRRILPHTTLRHPGQPQNDVLNLNPKERRCAGVQNATRRATTRTHTAILEQTLMMMTLVLLVRKSCS